MGPRDDDVRFQLIQKHGSKLRRELPSTNPSFVEMPTHHLWGSELLNIAEIKGLLRFRILRAMLPGKHNRPSLLHSSTR